MKRLYKNWSATFVATLGLLLTSGAWAQEGESLPAPAPAPAPPPPPVSAVPPTPPSAGEIVAAPPQSDNRYLYSAFGPGANNSVIGLGGRVFVVVPTFDFNYVRGLSESLAFEVNVNSLGVFNLAAAGVRFRLFGDESFSLALRGDATATAVFIAAGGASAAAAGFGVQPGVVASFGGPKAQVSLGVDTPIALVGAAGGVGIGGVAAAGFGISFRPSASVEFPVSQRTNLYIQGQGLITQGFFFGPLIAVGAAF